MSEPFSVATPRFLAALSHAVALHGTDRRKGTSIPYAAHLLGVCALVLIDGGTEDEAVAALLHDALEDHPLETSPDEIGRRFGREVLAIVEACSDTPADYAGGPKPPWRERKEAYLAHLRNAPPPVRRVALADKVDNLRAIVADYRRLGEPLWLRFNAGRQDQLWLYRSLAGALREAGASGPLLDELESLVAEFERLAASAP